VKEYDDYLNQVEGDGGLPEGSKLIKPVPSFCVKWYQMHITLSMQCIHENLLLHVTHKQVSNYYINACTGQ
jgi:hypothetical protein